MCLRHGIFKPIYFWKIKPCHENKLLVIINNNVPKIQTTPKLNEGDIGSVFHKVYTMKGRTRYKKIFVPYCKEFKFVSS